MIIDIVIDWIQGRGGLEDVLTTVSNELTNKGHEVRIFQPYKPIHEEWTKTLPYTDYYGSNNINEDNIETLAMGYRKKILETKKPDVIIATHSPGLSYICSKAIEFLGEDKVPIISWLHCIPEIFGNEWLLQYSDAHLAISRYIGEKISNYANKDSEIYYIGNPDNASSYEFINQSKKKMKYIYIGRLSNHQKRLDIIFKALSLIEDDFEYELDIIGDGPDRTYLENLAVELNIDKNINWLGWVDKPWEKVELATALILSSDYEGCPMVLIQSLGRGIPVIATDCSGVTDIINNDENGWIFEKCNYTQLYKILNDIYIGKKILPSQENCKKSVEKFETKNVVEKIEIILLKYKTLFEYNKEKLKLKNLILSFISNKDFEQANKFIESYKEIFGDDIELKDIEIELMLEKNDIYSAFKLVKEVLKKDNSNYSILLKAGYLEYLNKNYIYSIKYYYEAFNINNSESILDIIDSIYFTIITQVEIDKEFVLNHDELVGNIDINTKYYMEYIYKTKEYNR